MTVRDVLANGIRLAFDEHGAGGPVLLIGGTGMPGYAWDLVGFDTNAFVEAGYRVVTFDSRGVGQSEGRRVRIRSRAWRRTRRH
ncbi:MAG: alpha/beta hydrolase [Actinomycetota bacterium]|nr:alpha/beta hydrolase [Actinomycetota bacterium]